MNAIFSTPDDVTAFKYNVIMAHSRWMWRFCNAIARRCGTGSAKMMFVHSSSQSVNSTQASSTVLRTLFSFSWRRNSSVSRRMILVYASARIRLSSTWESSRMSTDVCSGCWRRLRIFLGEVWKFNPGNFPPSSEKLRCVRQSTLDMTGIGLTRVRDCKCHARRVKDGTVLARHC